MLSDEEKKAIDILKNSIADYVIDSYCKECIDFPICDEKNEDCYFIDAIDTILNLIKKQSKEIEELKEKDDANLAYYDQIYQNGIYTGQKAVEDKIKAKIEELNNKLKNADEIEAVFIIKQQQVLQSLLEKE